MATRRLGQQTICLPMKPAICAGAACVGPKEGEGPLGAVFDRVMEDELYGQQSFELAERQMVLDAARMAIQKARFRESDIQFFMGGDLLNQIISASFAARELAVPFIGLYGAGDYLCDSLSLRRDAHGNQAAGSADHLPAHETGHLRRGSLCGPQGGGRPAGRSV